MQARPLHLFRLAIAALLACSAFVFAAPPDTSPYYTDTVNSYVQDQVSKDMEELNGFLCLINAMAPDQLFNQGDYIAMVNPKACRPSTQQSGVNMGGEAATSYIAVQLNSTRESNATPMLTRIWLDDFVDTSAASVVPAVPATATSTTLSIPMYSSASEAPSRTLPYGVFRLDYCKKALTGPSATDPCDKRIGYIDANKSGLAFYTLDYKTNTQTSSEYLEEFALQLSANSSTNSGSGIVIKSNTNNTTGSVETSAIVFAHSPDYFYRDDGNRTPQCFNRSDKYAEESVWRYGLYDMTSGERLKHESGFPVEYTDSSNVTSNGYIGYWGLWMPLPVATGSTLTQITYDTYPPTKKDFTLLQAGGKLTKYTTNFKSLSDLHKVPFWYYPNAYVASPTSTACYIDNATAPPTQYSTDCAMNIYQSYEIYWDKDAGKFFVYSAENKTTNSMEKLVIPVAIDNASMVAADIYQQGLYGYSNAAGGQFNIIASDLAGLVANTSGTRVITQTQDVVYPKDFAAINADGGLKCITDCPTVASISAYNTDLNLVTPTNMVSQFAFPNYGYDISSIWQQFIYTTLANVSYSLDPVSGNMLEGAPIIGAPSAGGPVIQSNYYGIYSGRLITGTDLAKIQTEKSLLCGVNSCTYSSADVDLLANTATTGYSYYVWETSSNSYNQMGFLTDNTTTPPTTVKFYAPLPVSFTVPNTTKYGTAAGSTVSLQYSDFGNLWGIPYKCVDSRNNGDCVYSATLTTAGTGSCIVGTTYDTACSTAITPWDKQYWTAQYSIPFGASGVVTAEISQGGPSEPATYIAKGTQYLVKALDKELRLARVPMGICTVLGLDQPINVTKLPSADQWVNPIATIGTKPVLNPVPAPRVIHGVKQY